MYCCAPRDSGISPPPSNPYSIVRIWYFLVCNCFSLPIVAGISFEIIVAVP